MAIFSPKAHQLCSLLLKSHPAFATSLKIIVDVLNLAVEILSAADLGTDLSILLKM